MFCVPGLIFDGTEGIRFRFHLFRSRTCFWRCGGRRVLFSCFALPYTFLPVPRASGPVFLFCTPGLVFGGTEGVGSRFHVLCARTSFRWYRGCRISFSCFALPELIPTVPRVSGPVFMFCVPEIVSDGTKGVGSGFHILRSQTRFRHYRGRRDPFSCFVRPNSFPTIPRSSGPVFLLCAPELVFGSTEGVGLVFMFCAPE
jgi:hypothetical protein